MKNVGNISLVFLGEYVLFRCLVGRSSCFQINYFRIVKQQVAVLPWCNDDDRECLFQAEQGAQCPLSLRLTIPSLFLQTFIAVFFFHFSDLLPPYKQPIYNHFNCCRCRQDQTFFHRKKGFSLYPLFPERFSRPISEFFPLSFMLIFQ